MIANKSTKTADASDGDINIDIESIKADIARISAKIARKIEELENETVPEPTTKYRDRPSIREQLERLRNLYKKGREICKRYQLTDEVCDQFNNEPRIFRTLELTEACARTRAYLKQHSVGD